MNPNRAPAGRRAARRLSGSRRPRVDLYSRHAGFVAELGAPVVALLDPQPGERIPDLGCGDGVLTAELAKRGGKVIGVDGSAAQVEAAHGLGLDARAADGQSLALLGASRVFVQAFAPGRDTSATRPRVAGFSSEYLTESLGVPAALFFGLET